MSASSLRDYRGAPAAAWFLAFVGALTIAPGLLHYALPDGGAGVIAGRDFGDRRALIISLFAWAGATQIVWGAMLTAIGLRWRALTSFALGLLVVERSLHAANMWLWKGAAAGDPPPEAYATLAALPLLAIALAASLRAPKDPRPAAPP